MGYQIPAGFYTVDGNILRLSHFRKADLFSTGRAFGPADENYGDIGTNNAANMRQPNGSDELTRRKILWTVRGTDAMFQAQRSSLNNNYFIYGSGIASTGAGGGTFVSYPSMPGVYSYPGLSINPITVQPGTVSPYGPSGLNSPGTVPGGSGNISNAGNENTQALVNKRLELIERYCDKYGKTVDVDKIRQEYGDDPEKALKYCDYILNKKFDQSKLAKMVKKDYDAYNKSRLDAGKQVSDQWVDAVIKGDLAPISTGGGISEDNVLDVIGTFATNKEVKRGKVSLDNVMENPQVTAQMIETLKSRADEVLQYKDLDKGTRTRILSDIEGLRANYDMYKESLEDDDKHNDIGFNKVRKPLAKNYMDLFGVLRTEQAKRNDKAAPQYYGLPEKSPIKFTSQTNRANEETASYMGRRKLNTSF